MVYMYDLWIGSCVCFIASFYLLQVYFSVHIFSDEIFVLKPGVLYI